MSGECVFPSVNCSSRSFTDRSCSCCSQTSNLLHWIWASRYQQWFIVVLRYAFARKKKQIYMSPIIQPHALPMGDGQWWSNELLLRAKYGRNFLNPMCLHKSLGSISSWLKGLWSCPSSWSLYGNLVTLSWKKNTNQTAVAIKGQTSTLRNT